MIRIKHAVLFLFYAGVFLWGCSSDATSPDVQPIPKDFTEIAIHLENAYQKNSQEALDTVFTEWKQRIPAYTHFELNAYSDTLRKVYEVFNAFYTPNDLNRITGGEHENFETDFRYIVVQNDIDFAVIDTNPRYFFYAGVNILESEVKDFRPSNAALQYPVVYLTPQADTMIYRYLYDPEGNPKQDHQQRFEFLREALQLTHHHWIRDYHKITMPAVSKIYFDKSFTQALVTFRVFYQFGHAYFEKSENQWILVEAKLTGIE